MGTLSFSDLFNSVFGQEKNPYSIDPNAKGTTGISAEPPSQNKQVGSIAPPTGASGVPSIPPTSTSSSAQTNIYDKFVKQALDSAATGGYIPKLPGAEFGGFSNIGQVASHAGTNVGSKGSGGSDDEESKYLKYIQSALKSGSK